MIRRGSYGLFVQVHLPYETARERTIAALKENGFGVLTEIDVKTTLKEKLDVEFRKYAILGVCNPPLALRALTAELDIGLLMPCNVIVYENEDGTSTVASIHPEVQLEKAGKPVLDELAKEVAGILMRALETVIS